MCIMDKRNKLCNACNHMGHGYQLCPHCKRSCLKVDNGKRICPICGGEVRSYNYKESNPLIIGGK